MELYAAIDIMGGKVIRLINGDEENLIAYPNSPQHYAEKWSSKGFHMLHVVDLDSALGKPRNLESIRAILKTSRIPVQIGGGIRTVEEAFRLLKMGAARIIIGTLAYKSLNQVLKIGRMFGFDKIVIAMDYSKSKEILVEGWKERINNTLTEGIYVLKSLGFRYFLATSKEADGTLQGPDLRSLEMIPDSLRGNVIVAGGICKPEHVRILKEMGFRAAIVGRALYEGVVEPELLVKEAEK